MFIFLVSCRLFRQWQAAPRQPLRIRGPGSLSAVEVQQAASLFFRARRTVSSDCGGSVAGGAAADSAARGGVHMVDDGLGRLRELGLVVGNAVGHRVCSRKYTDVRDRRSEEHKDRHRCRETGSWNTNSGQWQVGRLSDRFRSSEIEESGTQCWHTPCGIMLQLNRRSSRVIH